MTLREGGLALAFALGAAGVLACSEPDVVRIGFDTMAPAEDVPKVDTGPPPRPGECPPGEKVGCLTQYSIKQCNEDGDGFVEKSCPGGQICIAAECHPAVCLPGDTICKAPDKVGVCRVDGSGYDVTEVCKGGLACIEGACLSSCNSVAKAQTNVGCNYALVDLGNFESFPQGGDSDHPVVVVVSNTSGTEDAHLEIEANGDVAPLLFSPEDLTVPPQDLRTFSLPVGAAQLETSINRWSWNLVSDQPITVHLINPENGPDVRSNDATLLYPTDSLGTEYRVMGWRSFWTEAQGFDDEGYPKYGFPSYVTIIATSQGETKVDVTPSADIRGGQAPGMPAVEPLEAGKTVPFTLEFGDVLNFALKPALGSDHDLTGTHIKSDRPVAVFASHNCAFVPSIEVKFCDHLEHQLTPVNTWVKTYVADLFEPRAPGAYDVWRIMAKENETSITTDPIVPEAASIILNAGEWIEYQASFPHFIQASGPIQVGHFMTGSNIPNFDPVCGDNLTGIGDPAFTVGVGLDQFLDSYVVLTPPGYTDDYVNIVRQIGVDVFLDGQAIAGTGTVIGKKNLELLRIPVNDGVHRLESTVPFGVTAYGYDCDVSYAYGGGMSIGDQN